VRPNALIHLSHLSKEFIMKVQACISFGGRCEEALEFYKKSVNAEVSGLVRWKESPDKDIKGPPDWEEKVMNASFRIGETQLMADDFVWQATPEFKGMMLALSATNDADTKRLFDALAQGGTVQMPLAKTFWTSSFGKLQDKFGVPWMVMTESSS
jgi:PhnB protein